MTSRKFGNASLNNEDPRIIAFRVAYKLSMKHNPIKDTKREKEYMVDMVFSSWNVSNDIHVGNNFPLFDTRMNETVSSFVNENIGPYSLSV